MRLHSRAVWFALLALVSSVAVACPAQGLSCGDTITKDTTLQADLMDCPNHGLIIGAPNITLDLNSHTIDGKAPTYGHGVVVGNHAGVTIKNGRIREFNSGIEAVPANRLTVTGAVIRSNHGGIHLESNWDGTRSSGSGNRVADNVLQENREFGIEAVAIDSSTIVNNKVSFDSPVFGQPFWAIEVAGVDNRVEGNSTARYTMGIQIWDGKGNQVIGNMTPESRSRGISVLSPAQDTLVAGNTSNGSGYNGIQVEGPRTTLRDNTANNNKNLGIVTLIAAIDGGGNKATGNVNPLQCVGVSCV